MAISNVDENSRNAVRSYGRESNIARHQNDRNVPGYSNCRGLNRLDVRSRQQRYAFSVLFGGYPLDIQWIPYSMLSAGNPSLTIQTLQSKLRICSESELDTLLNRCRKGPFSIASHRWPFEIDPVHKENICWTPRRTHRTDLPKHIWPSRK